MKIWFSMAESLSEIFVRLLAKQQVLTEKYRVLEGKWEAAEKEKEILKAELDKQRAQIERLEMDNEYLQIARRMAPDEDSMEKSRQLIAKLVRDVDKCIEQLKE